MNVHFSYKVNKTPDIEKDINHQIEKLTKRLQVFRPELIHLKGIVEQNSPREGFLVSLNLRLPSGQMAVQETAPAASAALKTAFDELLKQLTKHKDMLRSSHKWARRRSGRPPSTLTVYGRLIQPLEASRRLRNTMRLLSGVQVTTSS